MTSTISSVTDGIIDEQVEQVGGTGVIIILGIVVFIGLIANFANIYITVKSPVLHNSFGHLCASHSLAETLNLFIAGLWTMFVAIFGEKLASSIVTKKLGQIAMGVCLLTSYTVLAKAINRFTAIARPMLYRRLFSNKNSKIIVALIWFLGFLHLIVGFFDGCDFILDPIGYYWYFDLTVCGQFLAYYIDLMYSCLIMMVVVFLDSCTLFNLLSFYKNFSTSTESSRRKLDIRFFIQSCLTTLLQVVMLISFHCFSRIFTSPWGVFLTTTFAWATCSGLDGVLNLAFNYKHLKYQIIEKSKLIGVSHISKIEIVSKIFHNNTTNNSASNVS